jgi:Family of unknown function (DUF6162)
VTSLVTIAVVLLAAVLSGRPARAHIDGFGTPDPYWQNLASGSNNGKGQVPADGTTPAGGAVHPRLLRAYLYTMAAVFTVLAAHAVRRVLPEFLSDPDERTMGGDAIRTVDVRPPSGRREAGLVMAAGAAIVFGALLLIAPGSRDSGSRARDLLPFQMLFRDAPPPVQRMYRDMQEGLLEAEHRRAATKRWPAVATLAAEGIPPFAVTRPPYRWGFAQDGVFVNYVGVPERDGPAFLALVQEPDPDAIDIAPAGLVDEFHHRLSDGTLLHASIWFRAAAADVPADRPLTQPAAAGWTEVLVGRQGY